jgi:hypothetical protein
MMALMMVMRCVLMVSGSWLPIVKSLQKKWLLC